MNARLTINRLLAWLWSDTGILVLLALAKVVLHLLIPNLYGLHRDELGVLDDGRYLAWGYVNYPPLTPFIGRIGMELFGLSLIGLRLFPALAQGAVMLLAGLMARDMGGRRFAQVSAALAAGISLAALFLGTILIYSSFDYLWWVLTAYFIVHLLTTDNPRWWLGIGAAIGLGMMTKYTMAFLVVGVIAGVLLTRTRHHLLSKWLWAGVAVSLLIVLPNLIWQMQHDFISRDFFQSIHARDVAKGDTDGFLIGQFLFGVNLAAIPLWLAGLYFTSVAPQGKLFRVLPWMFIVPLSVFLAAQGRPYYIAPAYPMILAGGAVMVEQWFAALPTGWRHLSRATCFLVLTAGGIVAGALALPVAPIKSQLWHMSTEIVPIYDEEIGWPELVETVASIYTNLPAEERAHTAILAHNYSEAGAINLYGPTYGLPESISAVNTYWLRGYGDVPPHTLIVVGYMRHEIAPAFEECRAAGFITNAYKVMNMEAAEHPTILVCRGPRYPWPELWQMALHFG